MLRLSTSDFGESLRKLALVSQYTNACVFAASGALEINASISVISAHQR
jgi:hypothetical protein